MNYQGISEALAHLTILNININIKADPKMHCGANRPSLRIIEIVACSKLLAQMQTKSLS